jgi:hypothetical protein
VLWLNVVAGLFRLYATSIPEVSRRSARNLAAEPNWLTLLPYSLYDSAGAQDHRVRIVPPVRASRGTNQISAMRGIAGIWQLDSQKVERTTIERFIGALAHRGLDGEAVLIGDEGRLGLRASPACDSGPKRCGVTNRCGH